MVQQHITSFLNKHALVVLVLLSASFRILVGYLQWQESEFSIQQDNYADYAYALDHGTLNTSQFNELDKRLFPGYPILISIITPRDGSYLISGVLISFVSSLVAILLLYRLTNNFWLSLIFSFFPPIWSELSTKVATEPLAILLLLTALLALSHKSFLTAGLILGLTAGVRLIAIPILIAFLVYDFDIRRNWKIVLGFMTTFLVWPIYNIIHFGWQYVARQLTQNYSLYPEYPAENAIVQLIDDLMRSFRWGQLEILISGSFYLILAIGALFILWRFRKRENVRIWYFWHILCLIFILSLSPLPFLEELGRYLVPTFPGILVALWTQVSERLNLTS